ncbi:peptide/nickel transport system ATP-binding protein [Rhizobiales bacterium GAS191]|nr:peptide/nickel transport system ATP-binding protein [Rhizobiales bacterium GAS191]
MIVLENKTLLDVEGLQTQFIAEGGVTRALGGVSFHVDSRETLGIVGESGCGKSVTALSILRLLPRRSGRVVGGSVRFEGQDLLKVTEPEIRRIRGNRIAMIFQEPMTSLNPVHRIGDQIAETLRIHAKLSRREAWERAEEMLHQVRIAEPARRARDYPYQLSGGMRQRAMIAMALACSPKLLIADEPTTALDVTMQAQILRLILDLKVRSGTAVMLITHDLGVVAETCQRVIVMYAGKIVEEAGVLELFGNPAHPYTRGLMQSVRDRSRKRRQRLPEIPGVVPNLRDPFAGCSFAERCAFATSRCREEAPEMRTISPGHAAACWHAEELAAA